MSEHSSFVHAPEAERCTLTSTKRLSRVLLERHNETQIQQGLHAWRAPDILPWSAWLRRCYTQLQACEQAPLPRLLSDVQNQVLWENIVRSAASSDRARLILQPRAAAQLACKAQTLLDRWGLDAADLAPGQNQEAQLFSSWSRRMQRDCEAAGWISASRIEAVLCRGFLAYPELAPVSISLRGFGQYYPQQTRLLQILEQAGTQIEVATPVAGTIQARRTSFATDEEELHTVAAWCRGILEAGQSGPIAVVVPDLSQRLHAVEDAFEDQLHPNWWRQATPNGRQGYNISLGPTLAEPQMVADALAVLTLLTGPVSLVQAGQILMSEHIAGAAVERDLRARVDVRLRQLGETHWSLRRLISQCRNPRSTGVSGGARLLVEGLTQLQAYRVGPRRRVASSWAEVFAGGLRMIGWPGQQNLDSGRYQLLAAFRDQLGELASLDGFCPEMTGVQALGQLHRLLFEQRFQPSAHPAPVQIMGLLEAAGQTFEQLWITGMQDTQWPTLSEPNPFLPLSLQRHEGMPGADPQNELARAQALTQSLLAAAPQVLISHVHTQADQNRRVSKLVEYIAIVDCADLSLAPFSGPIAAMAKNEFALECIVDQGPPVLPAGSRARGGSAALQDQSACPFRAVAHFRLGAKGLETPVSPIDARVRGLMAHRLLQHVWAQLGDSSSLAMIAPEAFEALLTNVADKVVTEAARERPQAFAGHLQCLEAARLVRLARDWLEVERQRISFKVMASEQRQILHIGGLTLDMRLDRVDQLATGELFLIDYKTGKANTVSWMKPRPEQPQLPLYCLLFDFPQDQNSPLAGLAFASLKRGAVGFVGIAEHEEVAPDLKSFQDRNLKQYTGLAGLIQIWRLNLEALAREFASGEARVDPRDGANTCRYCDAKAFCRISDASQVTQQITESAPP